MKKFIKNPWVLGIGTTVIGGIMLSFVLDWIKGVDWLSTFKGVVEFIAKAVIVFLNAELKTWWVLVAIALIVVVLIISNYSGHPCLKIISGLPDSALRIAA